ncbi:molybdopterin-dependent oxidoreductase [Phyllobacterium sp. 21LDTY02-6]|uniref:nitrate reductase n=1 Tax=Phyllobacterium sp. 21LDTY02-6 TaxID=2944903 RepID=UPI0020208AFC|nr:nitrate reductase [Phyllobacterium sp. 21LDTY02-6]MCO4319472.1 molybdopterin-dependent oxidoreductase [Phyllobacterium sp. 21LDTY02-6]
METSGTNVRTACPYCGVGCGILAERKDDGSVAIAGDPDHPANFGRLCSKGSALGETVGLEGRLLEPKIAGRPAEWDEALDLVAERFSRTIEEHGPDSVAFYVSGQLLTEDYYLANKLMKGFIGSANIDTNSRLCMSSSVAGHRRAFGSDTVPGCYEDLEQADLVILTGSNLAWCHPVLYQRLVAAKAARPHMQIVLIDPRRTMTADMADLHLAIRPDGDAALFVGLLGYLAAENIIDRDYIQRHCSGFEDALAVARPYDLSEIAALTGLAIEAIHRFYRLFAATDRCVTVYSQGVNQSAGGTDKVNAIINCHLCTGRIGKPGAGPFSVTGQPNAMGGREVGGLANMLASHMDIENEDHRRLVREFWQSPSLPSQPGLKAVDLFKAIADGRVKAVWIMATNPVVSMPEADLAARALELCPFVVVSDIQEHTDTARCADVLLPAAGWGEKDGTVTNSERRISRQRAFLPLPGKARPDWRIIADVAKRMGFGAAFAYRGPSEIFAEHAALSGHRNSGQRDFDIGAHADISRDAYDRLAPFQWPLPSNAAREGQRFFGDGRFYTPDGRARFVAVKPWQAENRDPRFPFTLNSGRIRDQWHTMTRTGKSARLSSHYAEPFVELHPHDAAELGIGEAELVSIENDHGSAIMRALITDRQQRGNVFVPMHWTNEFASMARVDAMVTAATDPISGQPALKMARVGLRRYTAAWYGFAVTRSPVPPQTRYWAMARTSGGYRLELADCNEPADWAAFARELFAVASDAELLAYHDPGSGQYRLALFDGAELVGALYVDRTPVMASRSWLSSQLAKQDHGPRSRMQLLAGRPGQDTPDKGAIICSCFSVGRNEIEHAAKNGCSSVASIGESLKAGTNCGSCRAEIREILAKFQMEAAE